MRTPPLLAEAAILAGTPSLQIQTDAAVIVDLPPLAHDVEMSQDRTLALGLPLTQDAEKACLTNTPP